MSFWEPWLRLWCTGFILDYTGCLDPVRSIDCTPRKKRMIRILFRRKLLSKVFFFNRLYKLLLLYTFHWNLLLGIPRGKV
ncbi:hypothetical protein HanIR_Chr07g0305281 [Helianthus annuus]|nr:hypothetical protein HanIR_Chr07g0305281 [Helianthus annuus]